MMRSVPLGSTPIMPAATIVCRATAVPLPAALVKARKTFPGLIKHCLTVGKQIDQALQLSLRFGTRL